MKEKSPEEIYSSMESVWPQNNRWYNYTRKRIIQFILSSLKNSLTKSSLYLNAGSGGSTYDLLGNCFHVDIVENLIKPFPNHLVASIESLPFPDYTFDATICVGSVINYCDAVKSVSELSRTLKQNGHLVLEFERSNTGELLGSKEYGKGTTVQKYEYMGQTHTLFLYSENTMLQILKANNLQILKIKRFHCLSALVNGLTAHEEFAGRFSSLDPLFLPFSYSLAHNVILLCKKGLG